MQIAVIIPCYNSAAWIGEAIESVLSQSIAPAEIIVVNDGSTDNTLEVLQDFGSSIKVMDQPNRGPSSARNAGVRASSASWLAFLDADDAYETTFLESMSELHAEFSDAELLFTDHSEFLDVETMASSFGRYVPDLKQLAVEAHGDFLTLSKRGMMVMIERNGAFSPSAMVVHRKLFERLRGFCEGIRGMEDLDFCIHAAPDSLVGIVNRPLLRRRQLPTSLGRTYATMRGNVDLLFDRAEQHVRKCCPEFRDVIWKKKCGLLRIYGRAERKMGLYGAARKSYSQLVRAQPLGFWNWLGLFSAILNQCKERCFPRRKPNLDISGAGIGHEHSNELNETPAR